MQDIMIRIQTDDFEAWNPVAGPGSTSDQDARPRWLRRYPAPRPGQSAESALGSPGWIYSFTA